MTDQPTTVAAVFERLRTEMQQHFSEGLAVITADELDLIEAAVDGRATGLEEAALWHDVQAKTASADCEKLPEGFLKDRVRASAALHRRHAATIRALATENPHG